MPSQQPHLKLLGSPPCCLNYISQPPIISCDNVGATQLSLNPIMHSRMKHIAIDIHFVRGYVNIGLLDVRHVSTRDQLTDLLPKALPKPRFHFLRSKINGFLNGSMHVLRGCIRDNNQLSNMERLPSFSLSSILFTLNSCTTL